MHSFSQRLGIKPIRTIIQREGADLALRNSLWNGLTHFYFEKFDCFIRQADPSTEALIQLIWIQHYKNRIDELNNHGSLLVQKIKNDFFELSWNEMFDILEFIPNNHKGYGNNSYEDQINKKFITYTNEILKEHLSAYRFVDQLITEITAEEEIIAIEDALQDNSNYKPVQTHLRRALELLSDRKNPDYRNSIKESISAIESFSCIVTKNPKTTLGQALKEIEKTYGLHSALKSSFSSLYGYTSDESGIRHSLLDESTLMQEDAKFMLVVCSAFVNYLLVKTNRI